VRHNEQRAACLAADLSHQVEHLRSSPTIEVSGWLVRQDQARAVGDSARYGHTLSLASAELGRVVVSSVGHADRVEHMPAPLAPVSRPDPGQRQGHLDVLARCQQIEQSEVLEDEADRLSSEGCQLVARQTAQVVPADGEVSVLGALSPPTSESRVLLPAPEAPISATWQPGSTSRSTPSSTVIGPLREA
jgi:hypothetical protein